MSKNGKQIFFNSDDTHSVIVGATRCGKTRHLILPSFGLTALAGESMVAVDMKGELYGYTHTFLQRLGYECITIDFNNPRRSNRYNFLQPCIDAINQDDIPAAMEAARDIAAILVTDHSNTEPVWSTGARAVLNMAILAVVVDNMDHPEYQNLANVQQFFTNMCEPMGKDGKMPLQLYLNALPEGHPVKLVAGLSQISPEKMRGSFYSQALSTLDLFVDPSIHAMTASTDFDLEQTGSEKRAIFIILPDEKKTYHSLAALFVKQHYQSLVAAANRRGGRLKRRVEFFCDEFGNFVKIPDFDTMLTVSGGRGIRFHLVMQDFNQLDEKYGEKIGRTLRSNCETWIYLASDDMATLRELSEKCGKYTIKTPSLSGSSGGQSSASYSLTGRSLLMPDEIGKINRPYQLVTSRASPAMMYCPDISQTIFNELYGMGSKKHNIKLLMHRLNDREEYSGETLHYWGIWDIYRREMAVNQAANNT